MAVVRIKRRFQEEPIDTILLACKRRKTDDDENLTTIFKFTATVADQEENISKHISKVVGFQDAKSLHKTANISNITEKLRTENKLFSQNSRLKVVNCYRALTDADSLDDAESSLTIVDIESLPASEPTTSTLAVDPATDPLKYVYDIYYAPDCDFDDKLLENPISCHALDDLVFEDYAKDSCDIEEESDDSNDENNWRNDYPDEDPDSIGEDDMKLACQMGGLDLSQTNSLSSDAGEEDLVYGMDDHDGEYLSYDYASYKKRVARELDSDASEDSDFYYCDSDLESNRS
ncbi:probable RNA polymerase II nuclear localization protein SLC7A6OS [Macrosteles quadrilineatus]|uniref:probable RNA polymerase II nuclear localization protein SLC7A6OS n=1 Tax=Macrosteles quadrilineatus TaxID=74068 RepID=UPI0023E11B9F|nr:probable RNA polymerase II nuclear localization protein SLC7A6OS [Macrosteles quadrilineatus]